MKETSDYILAIDQGTTSTRTCVFTPEGKLLHSAQREFAQHYPRDGWVEHDPEDIWATTLSTLKEAIGFCGDAKILGIGITNQRETTLVWDKRDGTCVYNAIVWQDRRTADRCAALSSQTPDVTAKTGLVMDPYFSATKIAWILDHTDVDPEHLLFGTVDSFLIWRLTEGRVHATDATNACRTNLFNVDTQDWDAELCALFGVPMHVLPGVRDCAADYGRVTVDGLDLPILGVAGDQHAALIGQAGFSQGDVKATYGTGAFLVLNTGTERVPSKAKLLSTLAYRLSGVPTYALEGSVFIAGAGVQWLRDGLGVIETAAETENLMGEAADDSGVVFVPALTGLGAPYWRADARGAIFGITRDTGPAELARATVEAVAFRTQDLLSAMAQDGSTPEALRVDGGMSMNGAFLQLLADVTGLPVMRPEVVETTALGAAYLVGIQAGLYAPEDIRPTLDVTCDPSMAEDVRGRKLLAWSDAVERVLGN